MARPTSLTGHSSSNTGQSAGSRSGRSWSTTVYSSGQPVVVRLPTGLWVNGVIRDVLNIPTNYAGAYAVAYNVTYRSPADGSPVTGTFDAGYVRPPPQ
ncbi:hypothetical protein EIP91_010673 [Steccherinum ochraceum]|uniref:Uncharacterized protein n=1 Tax=Steccherinum ochraceum TaxID=92696 RepID=A0A4R0RWV1_9APHY|nr:hypothetical protein EIP91_010673 [Steccherinum ochraceum]